MSWAATAGRASLNISGPTGALASASSLLWDWDKLFSSNQFCAPAGEAGARPVSGLKNSIS